MADALPLVLWECEYGPDDVRWVVANERGATVNGLYAELRSAHERSRVRSTLHGHFLAAAAQYHSRPPELLPLRGAAIPAGSVVGVPLGGGTERNTRYAGGKGHVALLERGRLEGVEKMWERWKNGRRRRDD
jgi:tRNA pseudouridine38/39 synthase